jgi:hypothetical protein
MRPARALVAAATATAIVSAAGGAALGGWAFAAQHLGALVAAAASLVALAALALVAVAGVARALKRPSRARGATTSEFLIVIIPFLLLLFGIMQLALASLARLLVSYAAFAAARAAVVFVPQSSDELATAGGKSAPPPGAPDEPANQVGSGSDMRNDFAQSHKTALMRNAAAYAMIPASPAIDIVVGDALTRLSGADPYSVARALDQGFGADIDGPAGALARSLRKLLYARLATAVTLHDAKTGAYKSKFAWGDPIQARVTYLFYCQIPLANRFAGHSFLALPEEARQDLATAGLGAAAALVLDGHYMVLTADHTLVNQGRP